MAKTHPHLEMPTETDLKGLVKDRSPLIQEIYLAAHELVIEAVPETKYSVDQADQSIGYASHQFGYNGWGMLAVTPYTNWVTLTFLLGVKLEDPHDLLEGNASFMRHIKLHTIEQLNENRDSIRKLIKGATELYS